MWQHSSTILPIETVGLRGLRQDASELVRRVEGGEEIDITVLGRLAALVVGAPKRWLRWEHHRRIQRTARPRSGARPRSDRSIGAQSVGSSSSTTIPDTSVLVVADVSRWHDNRRSALRTAELHFGVLVPPTRIGHGSIPEMLRIWSVSNTMLIFLRCDDR